MGVAGSSSRFSEILVQEKERKQRTTRLEMRNFEGMTFLFFQ
jgi:hypothetical protein